MIRKFGHLDTDPEIVRDVFNDTTNWSLWMPGVEKIKVLDSKEGYSRVAITHRFRGRKFKQELGCTFSENGAFMNQLKGFFQKWQSNWMFLTPPSGLGTTLKCEIDMQIGGMASVMAPKSMIDSFLDDYFREMVASLKTRADSVAKKRDATDWVTPDKEVLLQVFQSERGLEMWFNDRMYSLNPRTDH
jgi:ribosome-associated toxin RatA of RatAB toxin-antitoxin module